MAKRPPDARRTAPPKPQAPEREHRESVLDEALEETFPASDPISPAAPGNDPFDGDA